MVKKTTLKVIIVMPAYNAAKTIKKTYQDLPQNIASEVIVVDDHSADQTAEVARKLGLTVFVHPANLGYGGNQKTCYSEALKRNPDIVVMVHPDYQYDSSLTGELIKPIIDGRFDIMMGNRIRSRQEVLAGGMPLYKYISNRMLTLFENIFLGLNLSEYHSGFRAYKQTVLNTVPFQRFSNDFIFDQQILISSHSYGFRMGEISVPVRYFPEASSINFIRSSKYGLGVLYYLLRYKLHNLGLLKSKIFK